MKVYSPPLPYTYKETELPEDLNYRMKWLLDMKQARVVTGEHGMAALILEIKDEVMKIEAIPVHVNKVDTATKEQ